VKYVFYELAPTVYGQSFAQQSSRGVARVQKPYFVQDEFDNDEEANEYARRVLGQSCFAVKGTELSD
jgi:hypothetical protein